MRAAGWTAGTGRRSSGSRRRAPAAPTAGLQPPPPHQGRYGELRQRRLGGGCGLCGLGRVAHRRRRVLGPLHPPGRLLQRGAAHREWVGGPGAAGMGGAATCPCTSCRLGLQVPSVRSCQDRTGRPRHAPGVQGAQTSPVRVATPPAAALPSLPGPRCARPRGLAIARQAPRPGLRLGRPNRCATAAAKPPPLLHRHKPTAAPGPPPCSTQHAASTMSLAPATRYKLKDNGQVGGICPAALPPPAPQLCPQHARPAGLTRAAPVCPSLPHRMARRCCWRSSSCSARTPPRR